MSAVGQKMLINGKWEEKEDTIAVYDPEDNRLIDVVPKATAEDMKRAVDMAADLGSKEAAKLSAYERSLILHHAADYIEEQRHTYELTIVREGSKTINEARSEVSRTIETIRLSAEEAKRLNGEMISFDQVPGNDNRVGHYEYFPIGVIGAITPFNDPLNLVAHKVGPAIAAGNAIVVKPATVTPLSAILLAEAFLQAGLPTHVLSIVTGKGSEIGNPLVEHPKVNMISFTGGVETGTKIANKAGLKKIGMELGSNSPSIILNDADLPDATSSVVDGAFAAAGQNCLSVQRVFIQDDVYEQCKNSIVRLTESMTYGRKIDEETDMGPLIQESEAIRIENWVQDAVDQGAEVLCGGQRKGAFYAPTVLSHVPYDAQIAQEEIFGPVVLLFSVSDLDEAIEKANQVDYGLQAGIFTKNVDDAFYAIKSLHVGGVIVNDSSDFRIDAMPFGGVKGSGIGREGVKYAMEKMSEKKVVCFKIS